MMYCENSQNHIQSDQTRAGSKLDEREGRHVALMLISAPTKPIYGTSKTVTMIRKAFVKLQ